MGTKWISLTLFIIFIILLTTGSYIYLNEKAKEEVYSRKEKLEKNSNLIILIEVDKKKLSLIDRKYDKIISTYPIASGKENSPTPLGNFKIINKAPWGEGFGSRWLGLNIPWGTYGIHGTNKPGSIGSNASAGCIRMLNAHVEDLYDRVPINTDVLITNGDYGPFGSSLRTLKPGDRGSDVLEVQKRLKQQKFYTGDLDGIYGEEMKRSLIKFLSDRDIPLTDKIDEDIYKSLGIILMD